MTGKTHRLGGVVCCFGGYLLLESQNMLVANVDPLVQLSVLYPFAIYGSVVSDLDHNWQSAPCKDPVSFLINKLLHILPNSRNSFFCAKHRSWQTHSDLFLALAIILGMFITQMQTNDMSACLFRLMSTGLVMGIISHLILDMLTPQGIWSIFLLSVKKIFKLRGSAKISLVPNSEFFATDGTWEHIIRMILWVASFLLMIVILTTSLGVRF